MVPMSISPTRPAWAGPTQDLPTGGWVARATMPCATIHLLLADSVLDDWRRAPASAPLDLARPEVRAAFLHGALAPDMGFIPGVERFVSELAHYVRPAALTRALKDSAETAMDEAFAWGWAKHVLGDVEIHPIVGRAVGERLYGDRERRVDAEEDVATHVSTEVGLDIAFLSRNPGVSRPPHDAHFDVNRIEHLTGALTRTYGLSWGSARLLQAHRRAVRLCRWWPWALRGLTLARPRASLSAVARLCGKRTPFRGFFTPYPLPAWMVREVERAIEEFPDRFRHVVRNGFAAIPDRNLETGGPAGQGRGHAASDAAARKLDRLSSSRSNIT